MTRLTNRTGTQRGFTLIEALITVFIIGIIAAIAVPQYQRYAIESRRAEARTILPQVASNLERFYYNNNSYTGDMTQIGFDSDPYITENGFYTVDVNTSPASGLPFRIEATAINAQVQQDPDCRTFYLNSQGRTWSVDADDNDSSAECLE